MVSPEFPERTIDTGGCPADTVKRSAAPQDDDVLTALLLGAFPKCPAIAKRAVAELEVWDSGNGLNAHEGVGGK